MASHDLLQQNYVEYEVYLRESAFLKVRKGPKPILIRHDGKEFANISTESVYERSEGNRGIWYISESQILVHQPGAMMDMSSVSTLKAFGPERKYEMLTSLSIYDSIRLRAFGSEWVNLSKRKDRFKLVDQDLRVLAIYQFVTERPLDKLDLEGSIFIDSSCSDDQIDAYLIALIHYKHDLKPGLL